MAFIHQLGGINPASEGMEAPANFSFYENLWQNKSGAVIWNETERAFVFWA
jgi:hypothetical protein